MQRIQLFAPTENPSIFSSLHVDAEKILNLAHGPYVFGAPSERRGVYAVRYDAHGARVPEAGDGRHGAPQKDSDSINEIIGIQMLRGYAPICSEEGATIVDNFLNSASPVPDKGGYAIMVGQYSNNAAYGRKYAGTAPARRLSGNARNAAYSIHGVGVDMENSPRRYY